MTGLITDNRKARYNYAIEKIIEAGLVLTGWEIKSLRAGKAQLAESHVILKNGEAFLLNSNFSPLPTAATHVQAVPNRTRKLLLHKTELDRLTGAVARKGYTIVPLNLHWKKNKVKVDIALARGKNQFDQRESIKQRDWERQKHKLAKLR